VPANGLDDVAPLREAEIRAGLERAVRSPSLHRSPRLVSFLRFVVEATLAGRGESLSSLSIWTGVFDGAAAQDRTAVRVAAGRLRAALRDYYTSWGRSDAVRIELPTGSYRPRFRSVGGAPRAEGPRPRIRLVQPGAGDSAEPTPGLVTLLNGEIAGALAHFSGVDVLSRGAPDARCDYHLRADLVPAGPDGCVTLELADEGGRLLWGDSFDAAGIDRPGELNVIIRRVLTELTDPSGSLARHHRARGGMPGETLEYEALLAYLEFQEGFRVDLWKRAEAAARTALAAEPGSALVHALLADLQYGAFLLGLGSPKKILERWEGLARRALAIDPRCEMARLALAGFHFVTGERRAFQAEADHAISLNPGNSLVVGSGGFLLALDGQWETGSGIVEEIVATGQPFPRWQRIVPYLAHYRAGEPEAALAEARAIAIPGFYWQPLLEAAALQRAGRTEEAAAKAEDLRSAMPEFEARGRALLRALVPDAALANDLADDLRGAGFSQLA